MMTLSVIAEPMHLFNLPITEFPLVLDVRCNASYSLSHVQGAHCINREICCGEGCDVASSTSREVGAVTLFDAIGATLRRYLMDDYPDNLSTICIYSECDNSAAAAVAPAIVPYSSFENALIEYLSKNGVPTGLDSWRQPSTILFIRSFNRIAREFPFMVTRNAGDDRFGSDCPIGNDLELFYPSMICPWGLFLGSKNNANNIEVVRQLSISLIINITREEPNFFEGTLDGDTGVTYLKLPCLDDDNQDMTLVWREASKAIRDARERNSKVLVHCHAGKSRSASTVIYYLMKHERMNLPDALAHAQMCRSVVQPNPGFMQQLQAQARVLLSSEEEEDEDSAAAAGGGCGENYNHDDHCRHHHRSSELQKSVRRKIDTADCESSSASI